MGNTKSTPKWFPEFEKTLPSQAGKNIVITGTTSGTGTVAATTMARKGASVAMLNRNSARSEAVLKEVQGVSPDAKVVSIECDLLDMESVKNAAEEVKTLFPDGVDVLCNNAGIMNTPDKATKQGFDEQMQTNHLSHFLLTNELMPLLEKAASRSGEARVVNHSSRAREGTPLDARYFEQKGGDLGGDSFAARYERYHQTKLANAVFTFALHDKLQANGSKVKSLVAHPGLSNTNLFNGMGTPGQMFAGACGQTPEDGTMGILKCMCTKDMPSGGGLYGPTKGFPQGWMSGPPEYIPPESVCVDEKAKTMLWEKSAEAVKMHTTMWF